MIYFDNGIIVIRTMLPGDVRIFAEGEMAQGWPDSSGKYRLRLQDQADGKSVALTAEYQGCIAGYANVYFHSSAGPFVSTNYPEFVDFGVLEKYRRHGIGTRLMEIAEQIAAGLADGICLGVGLHSGYGSAQRMYVKRGYLPDGSGVWYQDRQCGQNAVCRNDDELVLYLSKKLK